LLPPEQRRRGGGGSAAAAQWHAMNNKVTQQISRSNSICLYKIFLPMSAALRAAAAEQEVP